MQACTNGGSRLNPNRPRKQRGIDFDPNWGYAGGNRVVWNKGKSKETDSRVAKNGINSGKALLGTKRKTSMSAETRLKLSVAMKKAHLESRAWNIGKSRWNSKPSYPERFFMQVIENEFLDKQYLREFSFQRYALDFAWPHKRLCIEIDGAQHQRFPDYQARDKKKDAALIAEGWQVLRIKWVDCMKDTKMWLAKANTFIGPAYPLGVGNSEAERRAISP